MTEKIKQLKKLLADIADLKSSAALLEWDERTYMPPGGAQSRGCQLAVLKKLAHERECAPQLGELLEGLQSQVGNLDPDSDDARLIRFTKRAYRKAAAIPEAYITELAQAASLGQQAWSEARARSDFNYFLPHLEKLVILRRDYATFFPDCSHPYDALLDDFEPGMKTEEVKAIFDWLRPRQTALIQSVTRKPEVDDSFLHQPFDPQKQLEFTRWVITQFGYDWNHGRQDQSVHPFTIEIGIHDVRITTRVSPNFFNTCLFGSMHECGHALYGMGSSPSLERTGMEGGVSLGIHESQSRLWENLVGRSLQFWEFAYPRLQATFPQLVEVSLDRFYKGINKVSPSFIRVEADEATYNLHIMLRLELEIALVEGSLQPGDLPEKWNAAMQDYLGVTPPDDARGVLQDIHWSGGSIGYFATYALGNLVSTQLWELIQRDIPNLDGQMRSGNFQDLLSWLREKIHCHGAKFDPQELVMRATGSKIDPQPYLGYLTRKYSDIYGI